MLKEHVARTLRRIITVVLLAIVQQAQAQEWGMHWISQPEAGDSAQIWFRQTYYFGMKPARVRLRAATTGYVDIYVNEYNVSTRLLTPQRNSGADRIISQDCDVARFMRSGYNVIAVRFSPAYAHHEQRQLSLTLYGDHAVGVPFSMSTDDEWLARPADGAFTDSGEWLDGLMADHPWRGEYFYPALWCPVSTLSRDTAALAVLPVEEQYAPADGLSPVRVRSYHHFDVVGDSVIYDFGEAFSGFVRVTLRGARRGEIVRVGPLTYRCNGTLDEQARLRYTPQYGRRVVITGDSRFDRSQLEHVEAIELGTDRFYPFRPGGGTQRLWQ